MKYGKLVLILLIIAVLILGMGYWINYRVKREVASQNTENIIVEGKMINFDSLSLRQKIAHMIVVRGDKEQLDFNKLNVGGIFLDRQRSEEGYKELIERYQDNAKIKLLVSTDLEGAWNPFHEKKSHQVFPPFSEIATTEEAFEIGIKHGELLKSVGFNLNFAPVSELSDDAYGGRAFVGTNEEIKQKVGRYIQGLQQNVMGTCKHYPGNSMDVDLHVRTDRQEISREDLELFEACVENNISLIMVSHQIAEGVVSSNGKPSTVSEEVVSTLDDSVLVIADEINMAGLKNFYQDKTEQYVDLINAGENLILDFDLSPVSLYKLILEIEEEVERGDVDEQKIDESVKKILRTKGYVLM